MEHPLGELQYSVQLLHAETGNRVVLVQISRAGQVIEAALGEASTAEAAEDRARKRLAGHFPVAAPTTASLSSASKVASATPQVQPKPQAERPAAASPPPAEAIEEPPADPEDWSSELARLDLQLQRLGWDREQEAVYLERVFGHPNRNRLTSYGDLLAYMQALEGFSEGSDPASAPPPLRRTELLGQCEELLSQLQWDPSQGRAFLEQHFGLASRQLLSDSQLLQFNMLLESEWLARSSAADLRD